ncbi:hypothetical protein ACMD2_14656 [Ananas comosus]|uniref:Uncharacterized protein n=1 Tax=Ananas comosus TaxID=4615 RepID=A0A199UF75_ANACO|nr:hypothetical protein ACMD2_14656 [Ananas comosus]
MDSRGAKHNCRNGSNNKCSPIVLGPVVVGVNRREEEESVRRSLLPPRGAEKGGTARKFRKGGSRRKVQWNDRKGKKLVEVDSSDSDDDYLDSCICSMM